MTKRVRLLLRLVAILALAVMLVFAESRAWLDSMITWVESLGPWGPPAFIAVYVIATVLMLPGAPLGLAAGALFGVIAGTVIVSAASTTGASLAFLIARHLARDAVAAYLARHASFIALDHTLGREGWKVVALTRLSPVFPFSLLNFAFGLTKVRFFHYVLVSWITMLPGTMLYVYLGSLARAGVRSGERAPAEWALYAVGLAATVLLTLFITRIARHAIREDGLSDGTTEEPASPC